MVEIQISFPFQYLGSITIESLPRFSSLSRFGLNLQYLSLAYAKKYTNKGLNYLATGKGCHRLVYLDISGCTEVSLHNFFAAMRNDVLRWWLTIPVLSGRLSNAGRGRGVEASVELQKPKLPKMIAPSGFWQNSKWFSAQLRKYIIGSVKKRISEVIKGICLYFITFIMVIYSYNQYPLLTFLPICSILLTPFFISFPSAPSSSPPFSPILFLPFSYLPYCFFSPSRFFLPPFLSIISVLFTTTLLPPHFQKPPSIKLLLYPFSLLFRFSLPSSTLPIPHPHHSAILQNIPVFVFQLSLNKC